MRIVQTQNMSEDAITKINNNNSVNSTNSNVNKRNTITSNNSNNNSNSNSNSNVNIDTSSHMSNIPSLQTVSTTDTYHPLSLPKELLEEIDEQTTYDNESIQTKFHCKELNNRIFSHKTPPISHMILLNYGEHDKNEHWNLFTVAGDGTIKILSKKDLKSKVKLKSQHKAPITHSCVLGDNFIFTSSEDISDSLSVVNATGYSLGCEPEGTGYRYYYKALGIDQQPTATNPTVGVQRAEKLL
jgi:hypothetical protein